MSILTLRAAEELGNSLNDEVNNKICYIKPAIVGTTLVIILSGLLYYVFKKKNSRTSRELKC